MLRKHTARLLLSLALVAFAVGGQARAAEPPTYQVHADAAHIGGDQILVKIELEQTDAAGGRAMKAISRPRLLLSDGRRASITIGEEGPPENSVPPSALKAETARHPEPDRRTTPTTGPTAPQPREIVSGINVDVISVKGQDKLLVVSTVIEQRRTVWADAQTIKVGPEQAKAK
jgi:hypothetical protein